ncbi:phosphoserine aminotransferase [Hydrogenispora ethanolica]|uniref:Phosphoserine aminotransferase n=1 Tax=Hydrogenispora ethanolica TaxID=1082276 RepID=A0A4R1RY89_HYDET|nr:3-phosphoserine/phosphohydroxythreonine transaminase [Hydrogenispora ethanolica]TCL71676.1 phosphoserine aminotransferase [Hydrogenispora ethanolica]
MSKRVYNFNPGPAILPLPVLEEAQRDLLDFKGSGMSVLEVSHRGKAYEELHNETETLFKELLGAPADYRVLFMGGGASAQFALVPMNFLPAGAVADYILTGSFAEKAFEEAARVGEVHSAASSKATHYDRIPRPDEIQLSPDAAYVHITSNNTIFGTQWPVLPEFPGVPLVADMSSDILSRPFDVSKFGLIYAGAQKNLGPSGVTVVLISPEMLAKVNKNLPVIFQYTTYAKNNSLYNTPATFAVYIVNLVLKWLKANGGLAAMEQRNREKAALIYDALDASGGFYKGHAAKEFRSLMNVTFRLPGEELEAAFVSEAKQLDLIGLKGHRSVGGMRASIYNAMPVEGCRALADFMRDFAKRNG